MTQILHCRRRRARATAGALGVGLLILVLTGLIGPSAGAAAPNRASSAPTNSSAPTISGAAELGQLLTGSTGSWSGTVTFYSYQWQRCDSNGHNCSNISGSTASTYVPQSSDVGHTLVFAVTANNADGYTTASSAATAEVLDGPKNTSVPTISGIAAVGQTLSASKGSWETRTSTTYTYQWARCNTSGSGCGFISSATSSSYAPSSADVGHTLVFYVTANDAAGSRTAHSQPTPTVASSVGVPKNTQAPTISGQQRIGQTLTASNGQWSSPLPITFYTYQWQRCDSQGSNCHNIGGASKTTYVVQHDDLGSKLLVYVTANNQSGYTTAHSGLTGVIGGTAPANTHAPAISGSPRVGQTLTANVGQWSSPLPITSYTYQWTRCDSSGQHCAHIGGATKPQYTVQQADLGSRLVIYVTANSQSGYTTAHSALTAVVGAGLQAGAIRLGNGVISVPASSVKLPDRLVIDNLKFKPKRIQGRSPFVARFHVSDTQGHVVRGVLVYALGLPYSWVKKGVQVKTDTTGWATMTITPSRKLPIGRGHAVVIFVRALVPGQPTLAGSSSRRLVQITTAGR